MILAVPTTEQLPLIAKYVLSKVHGEPGEFTEGMYTAHAVLTDKGEFVGGVIYSLYRGFDVHVSAAVETGLTMRPHVIRAVFDYVFNQLGCKRCTIVTCRSNKRARRFAEKIGFALEGVMKLGYDGTRDGLIYGILAADCRYLNGEKSNGFKPESTDAA